VREPAEALEQIADSPPDPSIPPGATIALRPGNKYYFTGRRLDVDLRDTDGSITGTVGTPLLGSGGQAGRLQVRYLN